MSDYDNLKEEIFPCIVVPYDPKKKSENEEEEDSEGEDEDEDEDEGKDDDDNLTIYTSSETRNTKKKRIKNSTKKIEPIVKGKWKVLKEFQTHEILDLWEEEHGHLFIKYKELLKSFHRAFQLQEVSNESDHICKLYSDPTMYVNLEGIKQSRDEIMKSQKNKSFNSGIEINSVSISKKSVINDNKLPYSSSPVEDGNVDQLVSFKPKLALKIDPNKPVPEICPTCNNSFGFLRGKHRCGRCTECKKNIDLIFFFFIIIFLILEKKSFLQELFEK